MRKFWALLLVLLLLPVISLAGNMDVLFIDSVPQGETIPLTRSGVEIWLGDCAGKARVTLTDARGNLQLDKDCGEVSGAVRLAEVYLTRAGLYTVRVTCGDRVWSVVLEVPESNPAPTEYNWLQNGI